MRHLKITIAIVTAHTLTGTASVATRYLVAWLDPVEIAFLRYLFGSTLIFVLYLLVKPRPSDRPYAVKSLMLGILFFALFPFLFSTAFYYTTAAHGALVIATMPVWALLIAHVTRHEHLNPRMLVGVVITIAGLTIALMDKLVASTNSMTAITGELIMLAAALTGAIYSILAKSHMRGVAPLTYTPVMMLAGCLAMSPWAVNADLIQDLSRFSTTQMLVVVYLGCIAGGIAFFLFNWVLHHATATYATLFVPLNPLTAIFLGWLMLGEALSLNFLAGAMIVFAGLILGQTTLKRGQ